VIGSDILNSLLNKPDIGGFHLLVFAVLDEIVGKPRHVVFKTVRVDPRIAHRTDVNKIVDVGAVAADKSEAAVAALAVEKL
jgi:hypothetical protein